MRHRGRLAYLLFAVVAGLVAHCGTESTGTDPPVCQRLYGAAACDKACTTDANCDPGLFCGTNLKCTAECGPGIGCTSPLVCSPRGRCGSSTGFDPNLDSGSGASDSGGGGGDACIDLNVDLAKVVPTIYLLIDQSSTMSAAFGAAGTRWEVVRDVLMNADGGIVTTLQQDVSFGVALYTARVPGETNAPCPRLIQTTPALGSRAAIATIYDNAGPAGGTPTGDAIDKLIGRTGGVIGDGGFASLSTPGPKIIVLATDGLPDTCENGDDGTALSKGEAIGAAQAAFDAGIRTFVVAVGDAITVEHQKEMANAGAGKPVATGDASPFSTNNRQQFVDAINSIIYSVRSCVFKLGGAVAAGKESQGTVSLDGKPLVLNDANGWRLNNPSEIEVLGTSCDAIKKSSSNLVVKFPCGTFQSGPVR